MTDTKIIIGFLTISDRAARGIYEDISGPAMQEWISKAVISPYEVVSKVIEDEQPLICLLYTSPSPRDGLLSRMPSSA